MIIVIRCMSCGKPIAHLYEKFKQRTANGESARDVLDDLGLKRYCCRSAFMGQVDLIEEISKFKKS
ncbi:DNA-directed RNA polymerase subunit N [Candidatus Pacearchaeota archaeon]|nr:DNA-directed RNA polymerase subunit N [Candidatus Pacearchaeota archaeon]